MDEGRRRVGQLLPAPHLMVIVVGFEMHMERATLFTDEQSLATRIFALHHVGFHSQNNLFGYFIMGLQR